MIRPTRETLDELRDSAVVVLRAALTRHRKAIVLAVFAAGLVVAAVLTFQALGQGADSAATGSGVPPAAPVPAPAVPRPAQREPVNHQVAAGETLSVIALRYDVPFEQIAADNGLADPNRIGAGQVLTVPSKQAGVEVIKAGSTLSGYARQHATTVAALLELNPQVTDPDRITAGGRLRVPAGT